MARAADQYRGSRRETAKRGKLVWRALDRWQNKAHGNTVVPVPDSKDATVKKGATLG